MIKHLGVQEWGSTISLKPQHFFSTRNNNHIISFIGQENSVI